jgi:hypothetical protein
LIDLLRSLILEGTKIAGFAGSNYRNTVVIMNGTNRLLKTRITASKLKLSRIVVHKASFLCWGKGQFIHMPR